MIIEKLSVEEDKFQINLKFYVLLKYLIKAKLSKNQAYALLQILFETKGDYKQTIKELNDFTHEVKGKSKVEILLDIFNKLDSLTDIDLLLFSLRLYLIKDLLLEEAKLKEIRNIEELSRLDPLSLAYDNKSVYAPYTTRVNGALLALLFFAKLESGQTDFISSDSEDFVSCLINESSRLAQNGLEANQIFMLMFTESMNQSIISDSGSNYENRILKVLKRMGIPEDGIVKVHDKDDKSTEFDFFFELDGKTYGIGAKRTLRERYKQFIKTSLSSKIDVMIEITLGLDLNKQKAETIVSHGTKIFVADEIYNSRDYLQAIQGVYSVKDLTITTLKGF